MTGNIDIDLVIISGRSGSGKTVALRVLEDLGYYCIDNLPVPLISATCPTISKVLRICIKHFGKIKK